MVVTFFIMIFSLFHMQSKNYEQVVFESFTRGGSFSIKITSDSIQLKDNGSISSIVLKPSDWKDLCATLDKIDITQLEKYPSPTTNHAADAAWHSTIEVKMAGVDYTTQTFDNRNAPMKVVSLMNCINKLEKNYFKKKN